MIIAAGTLLRGEVTLHEGAFVLRMTPNGSLLWAREYLLDEDTVANAVAVSSRRIVVAGSVSNSPGDSNAYLMLLDDKGKPQWYRTMGGLRGEAFLDVAFDGENVVAVGYMDGIHFPARKRPWIALFSSSGELLWSKIIEVDCGELLNVVERDGKILAVGYSWKNNMPGSYGVFLEFDLDGNLIRATKYDFGETTRITTIESSGDIFYVAGYTDGNPWIYISDEGEPTLLVYDLKGGATGTMYDIYLGNSSIYFVGEVVHTNGSFEIMMGKIPLDNLSVSNDFLRIPEKRCQSAAP